MKFLYQDLINFFEDSPSKELLSEKLFQLGHEHEINNDIFEMEFTPNRGDCLSLQGLARDLKIFFGNSNDLQLYEGEFDNLNLNFKNLSPNDCPIISFVELEIDNIVTEYQPYLEDFLKHIGNNKVNFFTDISNYVSYELGQPTHCYDGDTISNNLIFEKSCKNINFKTLLGNDIRLSGSNCIFVSENKIINLAGVMGGYDSACTSKTKKVLIECAYFNPESIIGSSVKYNLLSDAAHKFERGVDILAQEKALRRFVKIVQEHTNIKSLKMKSFVNKDYELKILPIKTDIINKILGTELNEVQYLKYLNYLGFKINDQIKVPSYRHDISNQNDLAEEIARLIGYDNIESKPFQLHKKPSEKNHKVEFIQSLLKKNGFNEVINFPFTSLNETTSIKIDNPLDSNREFMRLSIKESLIDNLIYNERRQKDSIKIFEISDIYSKNPIISQKKMLGIILTGRVGNDYKNFSKRFDRSYLDSLLNTNPNDAVFQIQEISRDSLATKKKDRIFYVEIDIDDIPNQFFNIKETDEHPVNFIKYQPISEYPSSSRDFSFLIETYEGYLEAFHRLEQIDHKDIKHSFMFDFYKDKNNDVIKIGYRFIFQSHKKTLSDIEINKIIDELIMPIALVDGVSIPGV